MNNKGFTYDDIINRPHHTSPTRPRMSAENRAAQFSPFAALTGYEAAVKETARLIDKRVELDEYEKAALDERLQLIKDNLDCEPEIEFIYFVPDKKKFGGEYRTLVGTIKKIKEYERQILLYDGTVIHIDEIYSVDGALFNAMDCGEL